MMKTIFALALLLTCSPSTVANPAALVPQDAKLQEIDYLSAWPKLDRAQELELSRAVAKLKKASSEVMAEAGTSTLLQFGDAAAPALLRALGKEKKEAPRARLISVLNKITGPQHTRLLTAFFSHKNLAFRYWCLRRCAGFPDAGIAKAASAALKKALNPGKRKERNPDEVFACALAACSAGNLSAIEHLIPRAKQAWKKEASAIQTALAAVKGKPASQVLLTQLKSKQRKERLAALRFMTAAGTKEDCLGAITPYLDNQDSELLIAAINALRSIVEHKPPLPRLSAFDAISKGKEWKKKLQ